MQDIPPTSSTLQLLAKHAPDEAPMTADLSHRQLKSEVAQPAEVAAVSRQDTAQLGICETRLDMSVWDWPATREARPTEKRAREKRIFAVREAF